MQQQQQQQGPSKARREPSKVPFKVDNLRKYLEGRGFEGCFNEQSSESSAKAVQMSLRREIYGGECLVSSLKADYLEGDAHLADDAMWSIIHSARQPSGKNCARGCSVT